MGRCRRHISESYLMLNLEFEVMLRRLPPVQDHYGIRCSMSTIFKFLLKNFIAAKNALRLRSFAMRYYARLSPYDRHSRGCPPLLNTHPINRHRSSQRHSK